MVQSFTEKPGPAIAEIFTRDRRSLEHILEPRLEARFELWIVGEQSPPRLDIGEDQRGIEIIHAGIKKSGDDETLEARTARRPREARG